MPEQLTERLRAVARTKSEIARQMAEAKSLRQPDNPERRTDLYSWPKPEETAEWKAADRIEALTEALLAIEDGEGDAQVIARQTLEQLGIATLGEARV